MKRRNFLISLVTFLPQPRDAPWSLSKIPVLPHRHNDWGEWVWLNCVHNAMSTPSWGQAICAASCVSQWFARDCKNSTWLMKSVLIYDFRSILHSRVTAKMICVGANSDHSSGLAKMISEVQQVNPVWSFQAQKPGRGRLGWDTQVWSSDHTS